MSQGRRGYPIDFKEVQGQFLVRRATEVVGFWKAIISCILVLPEAVRTMIDRKDPDDSAIGQY